MASNFDKLAAKLSDRPGVTDPRALAAMIGRKRWGASTMAKAAAEGKPASVVAKKK